MKSLLISVLIIAAIVVIVGLLGMERPPSDALGRDQLPAAPNIPPGEGFSNTAVQLAKMLAFCDNINTVAVAGKLRGFSDPQIANGMCEVLAVSVEIIARDDDPGQSCVAARQRRCSPSSSAAFRATTRRK